MNSNYNIKPFVWAGPMWSPGGFAQEARSFLFNIPESTDWRIIDTIADVLRPDKSNMDSWVYYEYYNEENSVVNRGYANTSLSAKDLQFLSDKCYPMPFPVDHRWLAGDYPGAPTIVIHSSAIDMTGDPNATDRAGFLRYKNLLKKFDYYVGRTVCESSRVHHKFVENCNEMDEIHTQSTFCKNSLEESGVTVPVYSLPNGVDTSIYYPEADSSFTFGKDIDPLFKFFGLIDCHRQNTYRKGLDVLLYAYLNEFNRSDDTILILKTNLEQQAFNSLYDSIAKTLGKLEKDCPAVYLMPSQFLSYDDMRSLYNSIQCYVTPTRGEGFGIPFAEALACGAPVIATEYGGHMDFLNHENSYLVGIDGWTIADERHFEDLYHFHGLEWPEPSIEDTAQMMRLVYDDYQFAKQKAAIGCDNIRKYHNAELATHNFLTQMETVN